MISTSQNVNKGRISMLSKSKLVTFSVAMLGAPGLLLLLVLCLLPVAASAGTVVVEETTLESVAVTTGNASNPGVTCVRLSAPVDSSCSSGYMAIRGNEPVLIAASLQAKSTNAKVYVVYETEHPPYHCPWLAQTPCMLGAIVFK